MRRWLPSDTVGVTGIEYLHSEQGFATAAPENGNTPVNTWTAIRPGGGTPTVARAFRDDFRPYLSTVNGKQSVLFDANTRQLNLDTGNLPAGRNDKFWFIATKNLEVRSGDYYPFGYGGGSGSAVTWKMRRGQVPYSDIGTFGFNVGSAPIAASGISIITEAYRQSSTLTRSWYNGQAEPTTFVRERNTSASNARLGHWPTYGNGSNQHLLRLGWGYGEPTVDDILRLQGWLSWDTGDDGASLPDGHPYKSAPPMFDDGAVAGANGSASIMLGALTGIGAAVLGVAAVAAVTLGSIGATGAGQSVIAGSAAVVLDRVGVSGAGAAPVTAIGAAALGPVTVQAAGSTPIGVTASVDLGAIGIEAAAAVPAGAAAQISLGSIDVAASGRLPVGGTIVVALGGFGVSGTATTSAIVRRDASASITLHAIGIEAAAAAPTKAAAQIPLGSIDVAAFGRLPVGGMMAVALDGIGVSATATTMAIVAREASASIRLSAIGATGQGQVQIRGRAVVTLGPIQAVGAGRSTASIEATPSYVVRMPAVQRIVRMPAVQRVIVLRKGSLMLTWPRLRLGAVRNLGGDWKPQLVDGDTIISRDFECVGGVVSAEERGLVDGVHTLAIKAIRPGVGSVVMTAKTAGGETLIEAVQITVA